MKNSVLFLVSEIDLVTLKKKWVEYENHIDMMENSNFEHNNDYSIDNNPYYNDNLDLDQPIFTDTSSIMDDNWDTDYVTRQQNGIQKCSGKIFDSYEPYYRVAISMISYTPSGDAQPFFVLDIAYGKEDK